MNFGYEEWRIVFIVAAVLCGVFFLSSIALFFILDVKGAIGHITGRTAKKEIQKIKDSAHANSERLANPGQVQMLGEGRITDKISTQKLLVGTEELTGANETTVLDQTGANETTVLSQAGAGETTVPSQDGSNETTVLNQQTSNETTVLSQSAVNENTGFSQPASNETTVLNQAMADAVMNGNSGMPANNSMGNVFQIEFDITFIHTNEIIS